MARYYEETALIEFVKERTPTINGETTMECVERAIREAPTADVVPKSEVDRLYKEVDRLSQVVLYNDSVTEMKVAEAKQEVAREIFEEIEKYYKEKIYLLMDMPTYLAELKKKYTESEGKG